MIGALVLAFVGGLLGGNAIPHFIRGITKQRYPNAWGGGPIPNVVAGWVGLVLAAVALHTAFEGREPLWPFCAAAIGVLLIGLFHAGPGAFGRR
ncbi:hypothetical protein [Mycobacterium sp. E796]|uniref:hypothetical protein n=1 Tax=Mycobacterium sp. E796 TaxID=1834151 RepID=UPI00080220DA|nr:hypothetical protein [Mycobacterium sp. E796]OBI67807.1 hypothetical protein A5706_12040 [Mycobacterium sp. E796]